jgi:hypothetical protein
VGTRRHAIAVNIVTVDDDVAEVYANPKFDPHRHLPYRSARSCRVALQRRIEHGWIAALEVATLKGGHWRLFRVFHLYLKARAIRDNMDRLHQYCRCIDGLIVSKQGEAKAQFKSRTELFMGPPSHADGRYLCRAQRRGTLARELAP